MTKNKNAVTHSTFQSEQEVMKQLSQLNLMPQFHLMTPDMQQSFIKFCIGKKTLPLLYDVTFKRIFNPKVHKNRLSDFISCILGQDVIVKEVYPSEDSMIVGERLIIMDIIVELANGSIADVEIQKSPYTFAGERLSCFSSDLILRQYSKVKGRNGKQFKYNDLRPVYTIVLYEKSTKAFHQFDNIYLHRGKHTFDSGLNLNTLQKTYLIALDQFKKFAYHKSKDKLTGWLSFLVTEDIEDANLLISDFPWLEEIYEEISEFRNDPEEVFDMFSTMIQELDRNSMQYLVEELQDKLDEKDQKLAEKDQEIERLKQLLSTKQ